MFFADLAGSLAPLGQRGHDSALLRESSEIQRLIAELHGAQRARFRWTAPGLKREFQMLREEIASAVGSSGSKSRGAEIAAGLEVLRHLLQQAEDASLRSCAADTGQISTERSAS